MAVELMDEIDPDVNLLNEILPQDLCKYVTVSEFCSLGLSNKNFSILNYNIRSFNKNSSSFQSLLSSLSITFKCIVLSETWNN